MRSEIGQLLYVRMKKSCTFAATVDTSLQHAVYQQKFPKQKQKVFGDRYEISRRPPQIFIATAVNIYGGR